MLDTTAGSSLLGEVLDGNHACYHIPDYQRPYIWSDEQAYELWNDLMEVYEHDLNDKHTEYMLGAIVVLKKSDWLEVVDGQQRLVTLTLMFCAIRDALKEIAMKSNTKLPEVTIDQIYQTQSNCERIKLQSSEDDDMLQKIIRGTFTKNEDLTSKSQRAIGKNYEMFLKRSMDLCKKCLTSNESIADGLWKISQIMHDLKNTIYFVYVKIDDENQAYQVFQSLNSKGEDLNQADLIKSYLVNQSEDVDKKRVTQRWEDMFKDLAKPDDAIYESFLSRSNEPKDIKKREMYKKTKINCQTPSEINMYIKNLEKDLMIINYLENPEDLGVKTKKNRNNLIHLFHGLDKIKAKYFRRPIIAACRTWGPDDPKTIQLTDCLLKFFFMYRMIGDHGIDLLRSITRTVTKQIINNNDLNEIFWTILKDDTSGQVKDYVNLEEFQKKFKEYICALPNNRVAHYILASLEFQCQPEGSSIRDNLYDFQVEHIFPPHPKRADWPNLDELGVHLHRLGNLTLITDDWKKSFQNASFKTKKSGQDNTDETPRKCYINSEIILTKDLKKYDQWTPQNIIKREELLSKSASKVWSLSDYTERANKPN